MKKSEQFEKLKMQYGENAEQENMMYQVLENELEHLGIEVLFVKKQYSSIIPTREKSLAISDILKLITQVRIKYLENFFDAAKRCTRYSSGYRTYINATKLTPGQAEKHQYYLSVFDYLIYMLEEIT